MKQKPVHFAPNGLTLIELLVVIAILGLAVATVTTRIGSTMGPAALGQSVSEFQFADAQLRTRARHSGKPASLQIEIAASRLACVFDQENELSPTYRALGHGVRVTKCLTATQEITNGTVTIEYDCGSSQTFAVELTGRRGACTWLVVAGLTGQITELTNENAARELFDTLLPPGVHAG